MPWRLTSASWERCEGAAKCCSGVIAGVPFPALRLPAVPLLEYSPQSRHPCQKVAFAAFLCDALIRSEGSAVAVDVVHEKVRVSVRLRTARAACRFWWKSSHSLRRSSRVQSTRTSCRFPTVSHAGEAVLLLWAARKAKRLRSVGGGDVIWLTSSSSFLS